MARNAQARELGLRGEEFAAQHLIESGFSILERNWRCRYGELDIVAQDADGTVVFVEVKTRSSVKQGTPLEAITYRKARTLRTLALAWLKEQGSYVPHIRIDAICIVKRPGYRPELKHVPGIEPW